MPYMTAKQSPRYHQVTMEDMKPATMTTAYDLRGSRAGN